MIRRPFHTHGVRLVDDDDGPVELSPLACAVIAFVVGMDLGYEAVAFETPAGLPLIDARAVAAALHNVANALADTAPIWAEDAE